MTADSDKKDWFEIVLSVGAADADAVTSLLADAGHDGCELREGEGQGDGTTTVAVYTQASDESAARQYAETLVGRLPNAIVPPEALRGVHALDENVWSDNWKNFFPPAIIGSRLAVLPPWEDAGQIESGREVIVINPGLAFGTGQHETTALCLEAIDHLVDGPIRVADIGCGSAVLAIAAAKLGATRVYACDNDAEAIVAARENTVFNGVDEIVELDVVTDDQTELGTPGKGETFDLVVANILAGTLVEMRAALTNCVASGGHLVLSGIESSQAETVMESYVAFGWPEATMRTRGEWVSLSFAKGSRA